MAFEFNLDRARAGRAAKDADATCPTRIATALRPVNGYDNAGCGAVKRAAMAYFAARRLAPLSRHHALCATAQTASTALRYNPAYGTASRATDRLHTSPPKRIMNKTRSRVTENRKGSQP
jgi:hypothetical protein